MACHRAWPFHSAPIASTASLTVFLSGRSKATGESSSPWCAHQAFQSFSKSSVKNVFERRMMQCTAVGGRDRGSNKTQQKFLEPAQEQAEVVASGGVWLALMRPNARSSSGPKRSSSAGSPAPIEN